MRKAFSGFRVVNVDNGDDGDDGDNGDDGDKYDFLFFYLWFRIRNYRHSCIQPPGIKTLLLRRVEYW